MFRSWLSLYWLQGGDPMTFLEGFLVATSIIWVPCLLDGFALWYTGNDDV